MKGLGETLVGAYSGRALSFVAKKSDIKNPKVRFLAAGKRMIILKFHPIYSFQTHHDHLTNQTNYLLDCLFPHSSLSSARDKNVTLLNVNCCSLSGSGLSQQTSRPVHQAIGHLQVRFEWRRFGGIRWCWSL